MARQTDDRQKVIRKSFKKVLVNGMAIKEKIRINPMNIAKITNNVMVLNRLLQFITRCPWATSLT